ncbi:uncharacterized protein V6R79_022549 [Siganus canaliculatus]
MTELGLLAEVGIENMRPLLEGLDVHDDFGLFLHDEDIRFPAFPSTYHREEDLLRTSYDLDGIVVELESIGGLQMYLPLLTFPPPSPNTLRNHFHLLKKHVTLPGKGTRWVNAMRHCYGVCLGQVAGGYYLNLTVMPKEGSSHFQLFDAKVAPAYATRSIQRVREQFVNLLTSLTGPDLARETVRKNSLSNPSKIQVLEPDQEFILYSLGRAVDEVILDESARFIVTLSRFGQKRDASNPLLLTDLALPDEVDAVSLHLACTITPKPGSGVDILWSATGTEQGWVGNRGEMFPALSVSEAANYQTNLDGRLLDVGRGLLEVVQGGKEGAGTLNFLQIYADTPHTHLPKVFKHPVSGCVATCDLLHPNLNRAMAGRAMEYIAHYQDLQQKFSYTEPVGVRVEQVRRLERGSLPTSVDPRDYFNEEKLWEELASKPLLLPYTNIEGRGLMTMVYGAELGLEELVHGKPLSRPDAQLSQILGTSTTRQKSLSRRRGFLGLEAWNAATAEVSPPPLENWTKDPSTCAVIRRIFVLVELLKAQPSVVGVELWKILLTDLYRKPPEELPLDKLQAPTKPDSYTVAGAIAVDKLIEMVADCEGFKFPMALNRAKELVRHKGLDVAECLRLGLEELPLRWCPKITVWQTRHPRASWDRRSIVEIYTKDRQITPESRVAVMLMRVLNELERRGLCYGTRLERFREQGMPWLPKCMTRLSAATSDKEVWLTCLTFLSAVGLLENNMYVDFKQLNQLLRDLPMPVSRLQELLLLSKYLLQKGNTPFRLWKLHETIPTRVSMTAPGPAPAATQAKKKRVEEEKEQNDEDVQEVHEDPEENQNVRKQQVRFYPANTTIRWKREETSLIPLDDATTHKEAYKKYITSCELMGLPARSFKAFLHRRQALQRDK